MNAAETTVRTESGIFDMLLVAGEPVFIPRGPATRPALAAGDPLPPGPYRLVMSYCYGKKQYEPPFGIIGGTGLCCVSWITDIHIAAWVRDAMNERWRIVAGIVAVDQDGNKDGNNSGGRTARISSDAESESGATRVDSAPVDSGWVDSNRTESEADSYPHGESWLRRTARGVEITFQGETLTVAEWAEELEIPVRTIRWRLKHRLPIEQVLAVNGLPRGRASVATSPNSSVEEA